VGLGGGGSVTRLFCQGEKYDRIEIGWHARSSIKSSCESKGLNGGVMLKRVLQWKSFPLLFSRSGL